MSDLVRSSDVGSLQPYSPRWRDTAPREDESLDARRLILVLLKRKWQILLVTALVVVPAMMATALQQKLYSSTALLKIDPEPMQVLPYRDFEVPKPAYDMFMKTQEQVLTGPTLMSRVAHTLTNGPEAESLAPEAENLWGGYSVRRLENTQLFRLSYMTTDPERAAKVANTFADEYIKLLFEGQQEARGKARQLLERELAEAERQIQVSEKELVSYAQSHNIQGARPDQGNLADQKLATLASQVVSAESDIVTARSKVNSLQSASVANFPESLVSSVISGRLATLLQLEHDLTSLRANFGENWPAVIQKRNEIALVREQLDREKAAALAQAREQALTELRAAEGRRSMLASSQQQQAQVVSDLQNASIQYNIFQRNVETNRKLYEGLLERLRQMSVSPGVDLGSVRVVEPALPDSTVASPRIYWNLFLASVLGLALGISIALASDFWSNSLSTVEDVEHVTVLPVLAAIPLIRNGRSGKTPGSMMTRLGLAKPATNKHSISLAEASQVQPGGQTIDFGQHPESAEAVRSLCASILLSRSDHPPRVIVVTSTLPGEGKTTLSSELGRALADSGARTLLVECDMRRSRFGNTFGVGDEGGLSLFLSGHVARVKIHSTTTDKLFLVGAGPVAPNPLALLNSERMSTFLRDMAASFHFVILDTPPALTMADARVLGAKADGVVLVVRAGKASKGLLRRVCSLLNTSGANVLGAVLNGMDSQDMESSYYRYYRQYYEA